MQQKTKPFCQTKFNLEKLCECEWTVLHSYFWDRLSRLKTKYFWIDAKRYTLLIHNQQNWQTVHFKLS